MGTAISEPSSGVAASFFSAGTSSAGSSGFCVGIVAGGGVSASTRSGFGRGIGRVQRAGPRLCRIASLFTYPRSQQARLGGSRLARRSRCASGSP